LYRLLAVAPALLDQPSTISQLRNATPPSSSTISAKPASIAGERNRIIGKVLEKTEFRRESRRRKPLAIIECHETLQQAAIRQYKSTD
jgi:hypothetical protein